MNKAKNIVAAMVVALGLAAAGITAVYASSNASDGKNPMNGLVSAIASKFNLNVSDVQAVFDEQKADMDTQRKERMAEMEAKNQQEFADRLVKAVAAGKLTQDQADKITAKKVELDKLKSSLEGKTPEERNAAMKDQKSSLKQWAADNNIPNGYLSYGDIERGQPGVMGTVSAISGTTITLTAKQPGSDTDVVYTVDASGATVKKFTKGDATSKPVETTIAVSGIAAGDKIMVKGTVSSTNIVATEITDGDMGGFHRGGQGFGRSSPEQE